MKFRLARWVTRGLAAVLLIGSLAHVLTQFDWPGIAMALRRAAWLWLLGPGVLTILAYWWLRALRWSYLLKRLGVTIPLGELYWCTALSLSFAILTPMQSGEILKIELLKRRGALDRLPGYTSLLVERVADLMVITSLSLVAVLSGIIPVIPHYSPGALVAFFMILLGLSAGLLLLAPVRRTLRRMHHQLRICLPDARAFAVLLGLTVLGWLVIALGWQVAIRAVGIDLDPMKAVALTTSVTLINILSFVPGAIGVSEISAALLLGQWHIGDSAAQAGAIMLRVYGLLIMVIGLLHLAGQRVLSLLMHGGSLISHYSKNRS